MTQRFYFDLTNGSVTLLDDKGVEASDIDEAIAEAQVVLEEMRKAEETSESAGEWNLIIRDEGGVTLKTLPIA